MSENTNEIIRALREGTLRFGAVEVPCYVLPDGTDLLTRGGILAVFGVANNRHLERFIERIPRDSSEIPAWPEVRFRLPHNNNVAVGCRGDVLIDLCGYYIRALTAGTLHPKQVPLAARASVIVMACARAGITAAIWEATGFDKVKAEGALQDKLALTLREEAGRYVVLFSHEFFEALARLHRIELRADGKRPMCFAAFLAEFFYEWFDRDVYARLKVLNPVEVMGDAGEEYRGRKYRHHQFFREYARERFERHQRDVLILLRASTSLADFRNQFNAVFRGGGLQLSFGGTP